MSFIGKSVAALAVAIALVFIVNAVGDIYNPTRTLDEPVYRAGLDTGDEGGATEVAAAEEEPEADLFTLINQAEASAGEKAFRQCASCHTYEIGGPNRVGPNLGNVIGADIAAHEGFNYSDALAGLEGEWTYEKMDAWLANPSDFAPGNKMTFAGVKDIEDRAAIIKFLMAHTENPPAVPEPQEAAATEEAPAAEGEAEAAATEEAPAAEEQQAAEAAPAADGAAGGFTAMVAAADPAAGQKVFNQCRACHTYEIGGPNRVGPNLGNIVGADIAAHEGFRYSDALAGMDGQWTYENLNAWLENPKDFAPGNKMTFAGLKSEEDRAAVVAFMMEHTENPPPLDAASPGPAAPGVASETLQEAVPEPEGAGERPAPEEGAVAE
ncbi:Cytochrome cy [Caenispirillum salinarum AK4]|uniref:Cytochrome cy n=1 Tax=Caenispirillum salinarum AK4 TaxID=1238182 RepID=K9GWI3_9PROT|nr:cytochrome c family protein [Caenispirillum salinarum]EKV30370.1 Cytochrome cy [Caenispirillum salinarum AK4]